MERSGTSAKQTSVIAAGIILLAYLAGACDAAGPLGTDLPEQAPSVVPVTISISPDGAVLAPGEFVRFTAKLTDASGDPVQGSVEWETDAGTITSDGLLKAERGPRRGKVVAKHRENGPSKKDISDTTWVEISATPADPLPTSIIVSPESVGLAPGDSVRFSFALFDADGGSLTGSAGWSATGGTIDAGGLFVADNEVGDFQVVAQSGLLADTASITVIALPESSNSAPTAAFGVDCTNLSCSFDASASADSDGSIGSYAWQFGDNKTGTGRTVNHDYTSGGTYSVRLTVTDDDDATNSTTRSVTVTAPLPTNPDVDVEISPGQSIQAAVNANPGATTFLLKAGAHRRQQVQPKSGNTFFGEPGTVMDGEGVTSYAIRSAADNVTIRGIRVTGYAPPATFGAIEADYNQGRFWIVEDCEIDNNRSAGVKIGHDMVFRGNYVHHNGQYGLHGWGDRALIENNEISYNNTEGYDQLWDAGGMKFVLSDGLVFRGNHVHHNYGIGVWFDIDNIRSVVEDNLIEDNEAAGIYYEISYSATIRDNRIFRNGNGSSERFTHSGIIVAESGDVEIYGNTLAGNENGVLAIQGDRGTGAYGELIVKNMWVHDNDVTMDIGATGLMDAKGDGGILSRNNRFDRNTYRISGNSAPFRHGTGRISEAAWRAAGQDPNGAFIR